MTLQTDKNRRVTFRRIQYHAMNGYVMKRALVVVGYNE